MSVAVGFAVVQGDVIDVRTVSPTRRGALVNWLTVMPGVSVFANWSDHAIEKTWESRVKHFPGTECRHVTIITSEVSVAEGETPA